MNKLFLFFLFFLLLSTSTLGIGINPGSKDINYVPHETVSIKFMFSKALGDVVISVNGFLKDHASFDNSSIPCEGTCISYVNFTIPVAKTPGLKESQVCVNNPIPQGSGFIEVVPKVCSPIHIFVPYPGQYAEITKITPDPKAYDYKTGQKITFNNHVKNLGGEYIQSVAGVTYVTGATSDYFKAINFVPSALEIGQEKTFTTTLDTSEMERGLYTVNSTIFYGDNTHSKKMYTIQVGDKFVEITDIDKTQFYSNKINKAKFTLKNYWPEPLKTYVSLKVLNNSNELSNSDSKTILVANSGNIDGYIDLTNIPIGNYTLSATSHFADDLTDTKTFDIEVITAPEDYVEPEEPSFFDMEVSPVVIMFAVMLFLIIVLLFVVVIMLVKKK